MSQEIDIIPTVEEVKEGLKKIATDENIAVTKDIFEMLLEAYLQMGQKDKDLIRILIFIVAGISTFLAVAKVLTG